MDQKNFMNRMLKFNQAVFNNTFEATVRIQDQTEKIGTALMEQAAWLPSESRKALTDCVATFKTSRNNFKAYMDENYQQAQKYFV
jgi:hypothetical protein